ncbi:uncharacterized protein LOC129318831 isoform X2 [Prosopis cineraria]|nr:uncharacterized protein LOC129318831 isoform X2 [Prosopis cineraria]XP_054819776.1 uncharacterized protein LOC129318831 isoform X2 [Prosopis cineraria]XP_054819777.1 uncharacterized protein LOC129318831 isoform X2 [Prosopis cineraria]XP_054819778.1 uncharacterized protein LOC129318831 isoform X2 [Prosopis cineraria]XP_054819779.1 uncharacterized protein LOC129318831 isoform X2 [Prosopis cineraria]
MRLVGCSKLKSLFSVSIATTIMLENLEIDDCEELKHIITNEAEDDGHLNCTSIFSKLQRLDIMDCHKLEFIFPFTFSGGLQELNFIHIYEADELKYVFGKYHDEECLSNENENNEPHIDLPALEHLFLRYVPNMRGICIKNYELECSSLQTVEAPKEIKERMEDVASEAAKESEIQEIVNVDCPMSPTVGFQYFLNFHNLKKIAIVGNQKFRTVFSVSTYKSLPQLSYLCIRYNEELVNVVEEDSNDNDCSILPKMERLIIEKCDKLKFIFPFSLLGGLQKLKSLEIDKAANLKYIFGKYDDGDHLSNENESDKRHIDLPALEELSLRDVPKMIHNIWTKKYNLRLPSLQSIDLNGQEFSGRSFVDLMAYLQGIAPEHLMTMIKGVQKLTYLRVSNSKIEEVLNLEGVEIEGPVTLSLEEMSLQYLSELKHIWKAPKYILSLPNLSELYITECKKLRAIFCVSISKSLPQLTSLRIKNCDELVDIIEESDEDPLHQLLFPELKDIDISGCNRLKCLFSITTPSMFPKLECLEIQEASELEQVFKRKHDDTKKMVLKDVFPKLSRLILKELPILLAICDGIDFQTLQNPEVVNCPKYKEVTSQLQEGPSNLNSKNQVNTEEQLSLKFDSAQVLPYMGETSGSSSNLAKSMDPVIQERVQEGPTSKDAVGATMVDDLTATNSSSELITPLPNEFPVNVAESFPEDTSVMKNRMVAASVCSQPAGLQYGSSTMVASMKEKHEQGSQENDATEEATIAIQSTDSESRKQTRSSEPGKGTVRVHASQVPTTTTTRNRETVKETRDDSSVQEEPEVTRSAPHQSKIAGVGTSSPKLGICEIFQPVELKLGETALLAQALERYPQLLLPREHRTPRIIAWSYRVLVDILVMLATKTAYTITPSEKSTLKENLSEAIILGFDEDWVESVCAKVFGSDMSDVSVAKEEIQVTEVKLREIDSQLLGLSEDRKNLTQKIAMLSDIISAKHKQQTTTTTSLYPTRWGRLHEL